MWIFVGWWSKEVRRTLEDTVGLFVAKHLRMQIRRLKAEIGWKPIVKECTFSAFEICIPRPGLAINLPTVTLEVRRTRCQRLKRRYL